MITKFLRTRNLKMMARFCQFYTEKSPTIKYDDQWHTRVDRNGKLLPVDDTGIIAEVNDKYGLEQIRNPSKILNHLKQVNFNYPLNELVYFLRHLVHIAQEHGNKQQIVASLDFKLLTKHIKQCLRDSNHERFPYIGSYAFCFQQLDINDTELWKLMEQKVLDDEYYTNFKESVYAVQGFSKLPLVYYGMKQEQIQAKIDKLYKKLERIVRLTIWEVDVKYYHQICLALSKVNRFDVETFAKLEQHILTNLSMNYETKIMVDILLCFAKGKQGSKEFYDSLQHVIFKGHMFNRNIFIQSKVELPYDGHIIAQLLDVYGQVTTKFADFQLHPEFKTYVYNLITNKKTQYYLGSAIKTLTLLPNFQLDDQKTISNNILSKVEQLDTKFSCEEVLEFYKWIERTAMNGDDLPKNTMLKVESNIFKYADQIQIDDLILLLHYLYERPNFILNPLEFSQKMLSVFELNLNLMSGYQLEQFTEFFEQHLLKILENTPKPTQIEIKAPPKSFLSFIGIKTKSNQLPEVVVNEESGLDLVQQQQLNHILHKVRDIKKIKAHKQSTTN